MAVIYRCDRCDEIVENDEDIVKMRFLIFSIKNGVPDNLADWFENKIICTKCKNKILNFVNYEPEDVSDGSEGNT